jgi:hypothetical protein
MLFMENEDEIGYHVRRLHTSSQLSQDSKQVVLEVRDNGRGIPGLCRNARASRFRDFHTMFTSVFKKYSMYGIAHKAILLKIVG